MLRQQTLNQGKNLQSKASLESGSNNDLANDGINDTAKDLDSVTDNMTVYSRNRRNRSQVGKRLTKNDLVPKTRYHSITPLNEFLYSQSDHYAREFGQFFQAEFSYFEQKLDALKREALLNLMAEKRTNLQKDANKS